MQSRVEVLRAISDGKSFFDFGKAAYGTLEVELTCDFPQHVELVIGENAANGAILHEQGWRTFIIDRINAQVGTHTYRFNIPPFLQAYGCFNYVPTPAECGGEIAPFRYAEVNHYYGELKVTRTVWHDDWDDDASHFESSDPILNKVWDFCKYSIKATNVFGYYIDGDRERRPYEGDTYINQLGHFCCDSNFKTAARTLEYFKEQPTWPTEWQLLMPIMVRDYYLYSGDRSLVDRCLDWLPIRLLSNLEVRPGLIIGKDGVRDIIDWPETERDGYDFGEANFVPNAYRKGALEAMYELTGDKKYLEEAALVKKALRETMWQGDLPVDSIGSKHTSLHTAAFAIRFGIAEESEKAKLAAHIKTRQVQCSVYGVQYCLEALGMCNEDDYMLQILTGSGRRSWLNMMATGSTITMEGWDECIKPAQDWTHAWGAAPANIIPRYIVGLRPTEPGFKNFVVDAHPGSLKSFYYKHKTANGPIEVIWENGKLNVVKK